METTKVIVAWRDIPHAAKFEARNGKVSGVTSSGNKFEITVAGAKTGLGPDQTVVTARAKDRSFSFFLRDVNKATPIFLPEYGVAVTEFGDKRSYAEIANAVESRALRSNLQKIASDPEETYENAAAATRDLKCETWLGLSRDFRIFKLGIHAENGYWGYVHPCFHFLRTTIPEVRDEGVWYGFVLGRGASCVVDVKRRLEDGILPVLHSRITDEDIQYDMTAFVTLEKQRLTEANLRGTDFLVADGYSAGHMFTEEQRKEFEKRRKVELNLQEETVFLMRAEAVNTASVPRYAWFKDIFHGPNGTVRYDTNTGMLQFSDSGRVCSISRINGKPLPQNEIAVLLQPGEKAVYEVALPHRPVSAERARRLAKFDFHKLHKECREYWRNKLASKGSIDLPEPIIDEMVKAGLLHLDVVAYGREPKGSIAATIGVYAPIGSESSPIIQFFDSMGWNNVAERATGYFLEKQHDDGFIQNFGGYMLETGPALWTMGEHYRYTRDDAWVRRIKDKLILACEFMLNWRKSEMKKNLKGRGYGMQAGKVADPEDPFHSFMLNGLACVGMNRVAEMLAHVAPAQSRRWAREAKEFRKDIRETFFNMMALSPVIPLGDGSWVPTVPPWAESTGPVALFAEPGAWWTHGTFTGRDSMIGALYLTISEVLDIDEPATDFMIKWHSELMTTRNVGLSQPFYCRHDYVHAKRGDVNAFLKTYYNGLTGLADRETYTWWEHYFFASPHKTHEEGWWLMQTRWMLWQEECDTLNLLKCIPRKWMEDGKKIKLDKVVSYFGTLTLKTESCLADGIIKASVQCDPKRKPKRVVVRLPHPQGRKAVSVKGGEYDETCESVIIDRFPGKADIVLSF